MFARPLVMTLTGAALAVGAGGSDAAKLQTGDRAPDFAARGVDGKQYTLASIKDAKVKVVCFTSSECPVAALYENRFIDFAKKYKTRGVAFLAINVNDTENLEMMRKHAKQKGFPFPYAYDETGDSCRAFGARSTPHLFVIGADNELVYQGAFDDSMIKPTKFYVIDAVNAALEGKTPEVTVTRPIGCAIRPKIN